MPQPAVIDQLSDAQRQAVEDLLIAFRFRDYDGAVDKVNAYLEQTQAPVRFSRGSLHRLGSKLQRRLERIRASTEAARAIVAAAPDDAGDHPQAVLALIQSELFEVLTSREEAENAETMEGRVDLLAKAGRAAADVGRTSILIKKHSAEVRKAALEDAAKSLAAAAKGNGGQLSAEELRRIMRETYGV